MPKTVAVIVGSLRQNSINEKLARVMAKLSAGRLIFNYLDIGALPLYNEDLWADLPQSVARMKAQVDAADGVLLITPEFNRDIPGLVKNAFDWGSRPYGQSSWSGKPAAISGTSPGAIGTAVAQAHARTQMVNLNMVVMHQPEFYLQWKPDDYDADNDVLNDKTRDFLNGFLTAFENWIAQNG